MSNIVLVRLITGEQLVAEQVSYNGNVLVLKNVVQVQVVPSSTGKPNIGFVNWNMFSDDDTVKLSGDHVLYVSNPIAEFVNQYKSMFGGIVLPSSKLIM